MADYGWFSILPPLLAIALALIFRQVIPALMAGVWAGTLILCNGNLFTSFLRLGDTYLVDTLADKSHASIVMFSMILGGMIGVISKNGSVSALVDLIIVKLTNRKNGQLSTAAMGFIVFFDDYANTLLVGNTMRPITDRLQISREKLAYLIDSTAAPVATLAVISTWIGFEVGLIDDAISSLSVNSSAYVLFLQSLQYNFYPILTLFFLFLVAITGRDYGPMLKAEQKACSISPAEIKQSGERNLQAVFSALLPLVVVITATVGGLIYSGRLVVGAEASLREMLAAADSMSVLMWSSLAGSIIAITCSVIFRLLSFDETLKAWTEGCRKMLLAFVILILAWAIGAVCEDLGTANFLVSIVGDSISPAFIPVVTFLLAAAISFATGTSWGTMAILTPIVIPMAISIDALLPATISSVLAGAVFGDHCSPISDTTILSSMASGSDHISHVRTQLPYAVTVGVVAVLTGYIPAGYGIHPVVSLLSGAVILALILRIVGKKAQNPYLDES